MYYRTPNQNLRFLASMHIVPAASPELPQWALQAYEWADRLVFEAELGPATLSHFMAPDGIALEHRISASVFAALEELWLENPNLPALSNLRPWAAALLSATALQPILEGIEPTFIPWAARDGKEIQYLETPSAFPALADDIPIQLVEVH